MHDEEAGIWKMWYGSYGGLEGGSKGSVAPGLENVGCFTMYATSEDGIVWEKPDLGIVDFRGSTKNNIIFFKEGVKYCYLAPPSIKDPHDAEAGRWRYKEHGENQAGDDRCRLPGRHPLGDPGHVREDRRRELRRRLRS